LLTVDAELTVYATQTECGRESYVQDPVLQGPSFPSENEAAVATGSDASRVKNFDSRRSCCAKSNSRFTCRMAIKHHQFKENYLTYPKRNPRLSKWLVSLTIDYICDMNYFFSMPIIPWTLFRLQSFQNHLKHQNHCLFVPHSSHSQIFTLMIPNDVSPPHPRKAACPLTILL